ncbi:MAG: selenium-dependent molybdenum cofactor biosynthesis protein YqeB, partial [Chloroflexota bacterium]
TELPQPLAVRRTVAFSEAVYAGQITVEDVTAGAVSDPSDMLKILNLLAKGWVPVLIDPACKSAAQLHPAVIVDGRMTKQPPEAIGYSPQLYIGLGPAFIAAENCQAVIETRRGLRLGRVYWRGAAESDSGQPEGDPARVLRAPCDGVVVAHKQIGEHCEKGDLIAEVISDQCSVISDQCSVISPFAGLLRGLIRPGITVTKGMKIGDIDPRDDPRLCTLVSDKALAVGGGVLEAILSRPELRSQMWT